MPFQGIITDKTCTSLSIMNSGTQFAILRKRAVIGAVVLCALFFIFAPDDWRGPLRDRSVRTSTWLDIPNQHLGTGVVERLKTRWQDGKLSYIVDIAPPSPLLLTERDKKSSTASFALELSAGGGFVLLRDMFFLQHMTAVMGSNSVPIALQYQATIACDRERFLSLRSWELTWSFPD